MLGFGFAGAASGAAAVVFWDEPCGDAGAPGGGSGAPAEGPSGAPGRGIGGLLAPSGGKPAGATDGKLGATGFGPRVGAEAPSDGAIPGFVLAERVGAGVGTGPGPGAGGAAGGGDTPGTTGEGGKAGDGGRAAVFAAGGGTGPGAGATPGAAGGAGTGVGAGGGAGCPAKGCLVTLNFGAPGGRGFTGSPSLGVSLRDGRGGSGAGADILFLFTE
jgi:hypothetical protein